MCKLGSVNMFMVASNLPCRSGLRITRPSYSIHHASSDRADSLHGGGVGGSVNKGHSAIATAAKLTALGGVAAGITLCLQGTSRQAHAASGTPHEKAALNPDQWIPFALKETEYISGNTKAYRFALPDSNAQLGLPVASCLITRAPIGSVGENGKASFVIRPYTPTSDPEARGIVELVVKEYPNGKMSKHIAGLKPGDKLEFKGPVLKLEYKPNMKRHIGMVAGGTGITPMLQIIDAVLKQPSDNTQLSLVYANLSPDDILLKNKLDAHAVAHPNFKVYYVVDKPTPGWTAGVGFVTKDILLKTLPPPSDDSLVLVCGPPGLMKHISGDKAKDKSQGELSGLLQDLGYTKDQVYKF